ncbi:YDG/SRA domain-containing protein [Phlyctema vagabunda]|uniref:RING-type E3 ubiquitin transferase n=1 Tax=Phlyctema vagabunda TaxID=108571 RepID=A0ABR4PE79_9HELO
MWFFIQRAGTPASTRVRIEAAPSTPWLEIEDKVIAAFKINTTDNFRIIHRGKILMRCPDTLQKCNIKTNDVILLHLTHQSITETRLQSGPQPSQTVLSVPFSQTGTLVIDYACDSCQETLQANCLNCGCAQCGGKDSSARNIVCDECEEWTHWHCLDPPLAKLPAEDWFCEKCYNDPSKVILPRIVNTTDTINIVNSSNSGNNMDSTETKDNSTAKKGKAPGGMANVGHSKKCTIVPSTHRGPIPGIHVGQSWLYRASCGSDGVHRPTISDIAGSATTGGAVSIVLSGGYPEDVDNGINFVYTGSGGRDLQAKRTAPQTKDQELTRDNLALAKTCDATISKDGGTAKDWKKSLGVRVVRGSKLGSKFAPKEGYRYDGIYKLVKYEFSQGSSEHMVYRFHFRRDDQTPAPWTTAGEQLIATLGLKLILPPNLEVKRKRAPVQDGELGDAEFQGENQQKDDEYAPLTYSALKRKRDSSTFTSSLVQRSKCKIVLYSNSVEEKMVAQAEAKNSIISKSALPEKLKPLLQDLVVANPKHFRLVQVLMQGTHMDPRSVFEKLMSHLECPICRDFVEIPITHICGHVACLRCTAKCVNTGFGAKCTVCRDWLILRPYDNHNELKDKWQMEKEWLEAFKVDTFLIAAVQSFWPTYGEDAVAVEERIRPRSGEGAC